MTAADPSLVRILVAAEAMLRDPYKLCSDTSPDREMTQQRADILSEFYSGGLTESRRVPAFQEPVDPGHVLYCYASSSGQHDPVHGAIPWAGVRFLLWGCISQLM